MAIRFLTETNEPAVAVPEADYQKYLRIDIRHDSLCQNLSEYTGIYEHAIERNKNKCFQKIGKPKKFLQWIKVDGDPSWHTWTIDDLNPKNQEIYAAKPNEDPTLTTGWQVWNRKTNQWGDADQSVSIKYLHGPVRPTDLSVSDSTAIEAENRELTRVITDLKRENASLISLSASSEEEKSLIRQRDTEIKRLMLFNESLEEEIMKLAVNRQLSGRKSSARDSTESVDEKPGSSGSISGSARRNSSSPRKSAAAKTLPAKNSPRTKFQTVPEKSRKSTAKGPVSKEVSKEPSNASLVNGVRHTKYSDVKELIRSSKESLASYSIEKTWDEGQDEKPKHQKSSEQNLHVAEFKSKSSANSLVVDVAREAVEKISSTLRDLVVPQMVQDGLNVLVTEPSGMALEETSEAVEAAPSAAPTRKKSRSLKPNSKWKRVKKSSVLEIAIQRNYIVAQKASYNGFKKVLTIANIHLTQETFNNVFSSILIITGISLITLFSREKP